MNNCRSVICSGSRSSTSSSSRLPPAPALHVRGHDQPSQLGDVKLRQREIHAHGGDETPGVVAQPERENVGLRQLAHQLGEGLHQRGEGSRHRGPEPQSHTQPAATSAAHPRPPPDSVTTDSMHVDYSSPYRTALQWHPRAVDINIGTPPPGSTLCLHGVPFGWSRVASLTERRPNAPDPSSSTPCQHAAAA